MSENTSYARYVNDDLLGKMFLFQSKTGQRLGLANTRITSWVDFGEDGINLRTRPVSYESVREIPYGAIASVQAKRYLNLYYLISTILFSLLAVCSSGLSLIVAAIILWIGMGSKVEIRLNDGRIVCLFSFNGVSYAQEFANLLNETVQRARMEQNFTAQFPDNVDIESCMFIKRNMDLDKKSKQEWEIMISLLNSGQSSMQLIEQLCASVTPENKETATAQVNADVFGKAVSMVARELYANEVPVLYVDDGIIKKMSQFFILTNQRIIFYVKESSYTIQFAKIYKLLHYGTGGWSVNGLPGASGINAVGTVSLTPEQVGMVLAILCRGAIEQRGMYRIVINNMETE